MDQKLQKFCLPDKMADQFPIISFQTFFQNVFIETQVCNGGFDLVGDIRDQSLDGSALLFQVFPAKRGGA